MADDYTSPPTPWCPCLSQAAEPETSPRRSSRLYEMHRTWDHTYWGCMSGPKLVEGIRRSGMTAVDVVTDATLVGSKDSIQT